MPPRKIVDEQEVLRWFAEGKTYDEMTAIYRAKYDLEMTPSAWGNFRRRRGLEHRQARNTDLIPWAMREEHRLAYPVAMLRLEARRLEGRELDDNGRGRLSRWKQMLAANDYVVMYDPSTPEGFWYVAREDGDDALIRRPTVGLTSKHRVD